MKLYSTRHGESVLNNEAKVSGITDVALTQQGILQAETLAKELLEIPIDAIFSSPLLRARHTAGIIAGAKGMEFTLDNRLIEQNYGIFEGGSRSDPDFLSARNSFSYRIPGGESMFLVVQRVYNLLDEFKERFAGKSVLLISHSAVCKVVHSYFTVQTDEEFLHFRCANCELKRYSID